MEAPAQSPSLMAGWIESFIKEFVATNPENSLKSDTGEPAWDEPLVGFSRGDDPLWAEGKRHIGDFFWLPEEAFKLAFPGAQARAEELSVVAWTLPQTKATKNENAAQETWASERWARSMLYGELFNRTLRASVAEAFLARGVQALSPQLSPKWSYHQSERYPYASTWSERYAAHISGLGTFGLGDGLITPKGKAVRVGSVVVRAELPPTPRAYADHHAWCLFYSHGTCGKCISRCPVGALSEKGHDKALCREHVMVKAGEYHRQNYGLDIEGCGLCQVGVPCASRVPGAPGRAKRVG